MATDLPLNIFRTKPYELTTSSQVLYSTPVGYSCIVLGAQASNNGTVPATITFTLTKNNVDYILLNAFEIPPNEASEVTTGKLVIEEGSSVKAVVSRDDSIILVLSVLETSNE